MQNVNVVLDTNIWISIFLNGNYDFIELLIFDYNVTLCRSNELTKELSSVLKRDKIKKYLGLDITKYIAFYEKYTLLVLAEPIFTDCKDAKDNYLFDLARQSEAKYLVSGDKIVLKTEVNFPLEIISFNNFRKIYKT